MDLHLLQTLEQGLKATVQFMANVLLVWKNVKAQISNLLLLRNKRNLCTPLSPRTSIEDIILININFLFEINLRTTEVFDRLEIWSAILRSN